MKSTSSILILTVLLTVKLVSSKISNEIPSYQRSYAASKVHQPRTVRDLQQFRVGEPVYTTIEEVQQRAANAEYGFGESSPRFCGSKKEPVHVQPVYIPVPHQEPHPVQQYHQVTYSVPEYHHVSYPVQQVQHVQHVSYPVQQYQQLYQQYYQPKPHCGKSADSFQPSEISSAAHDMTLFNSESNRNAQYQDASYQRAAVAQQIDAQYQADAKSAQMYAPQGDARSAQMYAPQGDARSAQMYAPQGDARSAQMYAPQGDARSAQMYAPQADARSAQMYHMNGPEMRSAAAPEMKSAFAYEMNRNAASQADERSAQAAMQFAPNWPLPGGRAAIPSIPMNRDAALPMMNRNAMYQAEAPRTAAYANPWAQINRNAWQQAEAPRAAWQQVEAPRAAYAEYSAPSPMFRAAAYPPQMNSNIMYQADLPRAALGQYQIDGRAAGYFMPAVGRNAEHQLEGKSALFEKSAAKAAEVIAPAVQQSPAVPEVSTPTEAQPSGKSASDIQTDETESS